MSTPEARDNSGTADATALLEQNETQNGFIYPIASNLSIFFDSRIAEVKRLCHVGEWDKADTLAVLMLGDTRMSEFHFMWFHLYLSSRYESPVYHAREALRLIEAIDEYETNKGGLQTFKAIAIRTLEAGSRLEDLLSELGGSTEDVEMGDDQFTDEKAEEDDAAVTDKGDDDQTEEGDIEEE